MRWSGAFFVLIPLAVAICSICGCDKSAGVVADEAKSFTNGVGMRIINLKTGYYVSKYETRQCEFEKIMSYNPSSNKGPNMPVEHLAGDEAVEFCRKLTEYERQGSRLPLGYEYRLPWTREWEQYVADASLEGSVTPDYYPYWPPSEMDVGSGEMNRLGIYDLRGNVAEYMNDINPMYGTHVMCGASWNTHRRDFLSVDNRGWFTKPTDKSLDVGFRCVLAKASTDSAASASPRSGGAAR